MTNRMRDGRMPKSPTQSRHFQIQLRTMKFHQRNKVFGFLVALLLAAGFSPVQGQGICTNLTNVVPCSGLVLGQEENGTLGTFTAVEEWLSLGKAPFPLPSGDQPYGLRVQREGISTLFQVQQRPGATKLDAGIRFGDVRTLSASFPPQGTPRMDFDYFFQNQLTSPPIISTTNIMTLLPASSKLSASGPFAQACAFSVKGNPNLCFGRVGIENTNPTYTLDVNGTVRGTGLIITSDARYKRNIEPIRNGWEIIAQLQGTTYEFNPEAAPKNLDLYEGLQAGFIAQDVEAVLPHLVGTDESGYKSVNYIGIIPYLTNAIKELDAANATPARQMQQTADLESELATLEALMTKLEKGQAAAVLQALEAEAGNEDNQTAQAKQGAASGSADLPALYQNSPNPFDAQTEISYYLPAGSGEATIQVLDLYGRQLQEIPIREVGKGSVSFDANAFSAGVYLYRLVVGGQEIATKRMVLTD